MSHMEPTINCISSVIFFHSVWWCARLYIQWFSTDHFQILFSFLKFFDQFRSSSLSVMETNSFRVILHLLIFLLSLVCSRLVDLHLVSPFLFFKLLFSFSTEQTQNSFLFKAVETESMLSFVVVVVIIIFLLISNLYWTVSANDDLDLYTLEFFPFHRFVSKLFSKFFKQ